MDRGDIVITLDGKRFLVGKVEEDDEAVILCDIDGHAFASSSSGLRVESNPYRQWPFVILPNRFGRFGSLRSVLRPSLVEDAAPVALRPLEDWLLGDTLRNGGALYLSPALGLKHLDRVCLLFERCQASVIVPRDFMTVSRRAAAAKLARVNSSPGPTTVYDHLMSGDDDETE